MNFIKNLKLRTRILAAFLLPVVLLACIDVYDATNFAEREKRLQKAELHSLMDVAKSTVQNKIVLEEQGVLNHDELIVEIKNLIRSFSYGDGNYFFITDANNRFVVHKNAQLEGTFVPVPKYPSFTRDVKRKGSGYIEYEWSGEEKVSYASYIPELDMYLATGMTMTAINEEIQATYFELLIQLAGMCALFIFFSAVLVRSIKEPFDAISQLMDCVANGDLSKRIIHIDKSELGEVSTAINQATEQFAKMVSQITGASESISASSLQLNASTEETADSMQSQQSELEQVSTAVTEMSATIQDVAGNVNETAKAASEADSRATQGMDQLEETVAMMQQLENTFQKVVVAINELATDTQQISAITESIENVSNQTNLLALNAAIEAARAGDAGRGFAVVADEVRTLSKRTGESTDEIRGVVTELQDKAHALVELMNVSTTTFSEAQQLTNESRKSVLVIAESIVHIDSMATQVASATEEQSVVASEINQNVSVVADAANSTTNSAVTISESAAALSQLANELGELARRFKL